MAVLSDKNKLLLVVNPVSGKGLGKSKLYEMIEIFSRHGYRVTVMLTEPEGTKQKIIEEAENYDLVVAVGGDGTLNMVAGGIVRSGVDVPMGYIPLGSTNDFGYSLGLGTNIGAICERIATGEPKYIDMGKCDDRYFVYVMCTGLFSSVSYMTSQQLKNLMGRNAYIVSGVSQVKNAKKMRYTVQLEDETIQENLLFASVSNTLRLGGMLSFPKSEVQFDDGMFELTLVKYPNHITDSAALTADLLNGKMPSERFIRRKVRSATIRFSDPQDWSIDGENGGIHNEIKIEVIQKALRLIY